MAPTTDPIFENAPMPPSAQMRYDETTRQVRWPLEGATVPVFDLQRVTQLCTDLTIINALLRTHECIHPSIHLPTHSYVRTHTRMHARNGILKSNRYDGIVWYFFFVLN